MLEFSEPVDLLDCSAISLAFFSGLNFSLANCSSSAEYEEYGTTVFFRLPESERCLSEQEKCVNILLSFSSGSAAEVVSELLSGPDPNPNISLSISAGALSDYAESPNYSLEVIAELEVGPGESCIQRDEVGAACVVPNFLSVILIAQTAHPVRLERM